MAHSFMIHFTCNGKPCFANVHAYDSTPAEYHVHILNAYLFPGVPEELVLMEQNEKLCLRNKDGVPDDIVMAIVTEIEKQRKDGKKSMQ